MKITKDALPIPKQCDHCKSLNIVFENNEKVYGKEFGEWPYIWHCKECLSSVGCHANTKIPLGLMAPKSIRRLRAKVHFVFDKIWQNGAMTRNEAYKWLGEKVDITSKDCHISQMSKQQLDIALEASVYFMNNEYKSFVRKARKKETENNEQRTRQQFERKIAKHIRIRKAKR